MIGLLFIYYLFTMIAYRESRGIGSSDMFAFFINLPKTPKLRPSALTGLFGGSEDGCGLGGATTTVGGSGTGDAGGDTASSTLDALLLRRLCIALKHW